MAAGAGVLFCDQSRIRSAGALMGHLQKELFNGRNLGQREGSLYDFLLKHGGLRLVVQAVDGTPLPAPIAQSVSYSLHAVEKLRTSRRTTTEGGEPVKHRVTLKRAAGEADSSDTDKDIGVPGDFPATPGDHEKQKEAACRGCCTCGRGTSKSAGKEKGTVQRHRAKRPRLTLSAARSLKPTGGAVLVTAPGDAHRPEGEAPAAHPPESKSELDVDDGGAAPTAAEGLLAAPLAE